LERLSRPAELRRIDVKDSEIADVASREARSADAFVALRLDGSWTPRESEQLVEGVLFGSGRHLLLVSDIVPASDGFAHALIAWNGSREAARAMGEALPYLHKSREVTVVVVDRDPPAEFDAVVGEDAVGYLRLHGIDAHLQRAIGRKVDVATALMVEADRLRADLMVMGGYGRSPLREWFMGGVTYRLLRDAPVPLLVAH
jgi:nucleotide-binding universal stress UspA family protein